MYVGPNILFRDDKTHCNILRKNFNTNMFQTGFLLKPLVPKIQVFCLDY
jgi:hypothetical protein